MCVIYDTYKMSTARSFSFICLVLAVVGGVSGREYTVSGVSSGAFMAIQNHVAYNKDVVGVAAIAGGPFFCAQAKLEIALHACMVEPEFISVEELVAVTYSTYATTGTIDSPAYTAGDKIWLFSGVQDHKVNSGVVAKAYTYYTGIGADESDMELRNDIQAAHAMVTDNFGNDCTYFGSPYIDNCQFDAAGHLLSHLLGKELKPREKAPESNIVSFSQSKYGIFNESVGFAENGYAYVPTGCQNGNMQSCDLHVAYHGCLQAPENINTTFVLHAGYNEWAEANNVVVIYPQAKSNALNPEGCWDWWGFTGPAYASKVGLQLQVIGKMVEDWGSRSSSSF